MNHPRSLAWAAIFLGVGLVGPACSAVGTRSSSAGGTGGSGHGASGSGASGSGGFTGTGGTPSGTGGSTASSSGTTDGGAPTNCGAGSSDLSGCACGAAGMTQPCYPLSANPKTRGVGACKDGTQTCQGGEVLTWGPCTGAVTPAADSCTGTTDLNCNGQIGCQDPSCASNPACNGACADGATRPCYDGPAGTEGTGTCKPGTQTCVNGSWSTTCVGEVLPAPEICSDLLDHNCNGLPGCFDVFNCLTDPACMPPPCMPANGCTCPTGTGDSAVCPNGSYGDPYTGLCCPCSASTCDQLGCCGESVCAGAAACAPLTCGPLPAACNGMVNADCDWEDLSTADAQNPPEDCDMMCCKCRPALCP